ncbi:hypothetical protein EYF80_029632 [Liparis tanakae]|uniref:Uncharacterized protein n=1 Tax=Liparis tanakae TaxID=230148 RepID=A0A4Z2H361_9TELE|nr:hypothetical protein EYF80_029632 [Liparis tanakae]
MNKDKSNSSKAARELKLSGSILLIRFSLRLSFVRLRSPLSADRCRTSIRFPVRSSSPRTSGRPNQFGLTSVRRFWFKPRNVRRVSDPKAPSAIPVTPARSIRSRVTETRPWLRNAVALISPTSLETSTREE